MYSSRIALRSARVVRSRPLRQLNQRRTQHSSSSSSVGGGTSTNNTSSSSALYGGIAGGTVAFVFGYAWYSFSGAKSIVNTAQQTKDYYESSKNKLKQNAPEPNEALKWLRQQTSFYASFVPGGKGFVDSTFHDLDTIREKHGDEVDKIVKEAYEDLKDVANKDLSVATANEAWQVLQKHLKRITNLASDSAHEILDNHPQLQSKIGGNVSQLRSYGETLGPEANQVVQDTWTQMRDIVASSGISAASIQKLQQLIQEKTEQVKKLGNKAWDKGMQDAKPYLEKSPKLKELLESNKKDLLSSNLSELWSKVKKASETGNTDDLEKFVKQSADTAKEQSDSAGGDISSSMSSMASSSTVEKFLNQVLPGNGGSQLMPKFQQIQEMLEKTDTKEMEKLAKDTVAEIKGVLEKKVNEGKKLVGDSDSGNAKS